VPVRTKLKADEASLVIRRRLLIAALAGALGGAVPVLVAVGAQTTVSPATLVGALRRGGYVIIMRHAASPQARPSAEAANKDNPNRERQLDQTGRRTAAAMGSAIRSKAIPVGEVWSSPTYRALETARLAGLTGVKTAAELGEGGADMQAASKAAADWLRKRAASAPAAGTNTVLITHFPNIRAAFPEQSGGLGDGEALVFRPDGTGEPTFVGRLPITAWGGG
jgi:phosphohistidine phosphatase SixA